MVSDEAVFVLGLPAREAVQDEVSWMRVDGAAGSDGGYFFRAREEQNHEQDL